MKSQNLVQAGFFYVSWLDRPAGPEHQRLIKLRKEVLFYARQR